ncbi:hypothetical protein OUZ56_012305 [Daphnia magna]|uniref:Reverse transcriptase domain-containing protein n=1 Tax=Daphnia magna TaxID=35525 RepID=A0ABQ9Z2L8_9CRUS|nr:hypothetical protein OUZ56_012305 [Daphnia magna]
MEVIRPRNTEQGPPHSTERDLFEENPPSRPFELEINGSICSDPADILSNFDDHFFQKDKPSNQEHITAEAIKKKSAPGMDGLTVQLNLLCLNSLVGPLATIFNSCSKILEKILLNRLKQLAQF